MRIVEKKTGDEPKDVYTSDIELEAGKDYEVFIYYHNNASATFNDKAHDYVGVSRETRMVTTFPDELKAGQRSQVSGIIRSENAEPAEVWGIKIAKRAYTQFKKSVKSHISTQQAVYDKMLAETISYGDEGSEGIEWIKTAMTDSLKNMKELSSYLSKTKFCDLSEAMKARLILNIVESNDFLGTKKLLSIVEDKYGHSTSVLTC